MRKYAIVIGENNEDLSRQVQDALFKVGFMWMTRDGRRSVTAKIRYPESPLLIIEHGLICCLGVLSTGIHSHDFEGEVFYITPSYVLANAHLLDRANNPENLISVSEATKILKKHLGDNVRITI